ncbi:putative F-box/LRR-repeat protein [Zostera marina]|uniref:Putative F-box/LRR-repeat protein n=1 Tax=Zostera marina TaxID=29655 RepID=A0A0K9NL12_ZOSMR|nr:putative F-box/LRR-repeat protein [Zostera marina]
MEEEAWGMEIVPRVMEIVSSRLDQIDVYSLLLISPWCYRALISVPSIWQVLDLHGKSNAGVKLSSAISLPRYSHVQHINLEFAQTIEDRHLIILKEKLKSPNDLHTLNLNACQKVSDKGIEVVACAFQNLKSLSLYWNVRLSDKSILHLVKNCPHMIHLNLSGCKNISDQSMFLIAENYKSLKTLNLTRCVKLTDIGLQQILMSCSSLISLNLYALSSFTDRAYEKISRLEQLRFLDLCGAQNLSDSSLYQIARCKNLVSLNLTWCVRATDIGVQAIACGCTNLEYLSLFGIVGVTDKCIEALAITCSKILTTLDVNGCIGIKKRGREELLKIFPNLKCFKVHS